MVQKPETTVAAIITDKDSSGVKVLLTQRGPEMRNYPDGWCLPGGHIEPGESWVAAIRREVGEETKLGFRARFFGSFDEDIPAYGIHHVVKVYEGCGVGEPEIAPPEVVEVRWVALEEARTWELAFQHNDILDAYARRVVSPERREELLAEYEALRSEVLTRIELRHQSLHLAIAAISIFVAAAAIKDVDPVVLMLYPLVALCIAVAWTQNDMRIGQLGKHVKENIEQQLPGIGWEHGLIERLAGLSSIYKRFTELTGVGLFVGTQLVTTVFGFALTIVKGQLVWWGIPLLAADLAAMGATWWLIRRRRRQYR